MARNAPSTAKCYINYYRHDADNIKDVRLIGLTH